MKFASPGVCEGSGDGAPVALMSPGESQVWLSPPPTCSTERPIAPTAPRRLALVSFVRPGSAGASGEGRSE